MHILYVSSVRQQQQRPYYKGHNLLQQLFVNSSAADARETLQVDRASTFVAHWSIRGACSPRTRPMPSFTPDSK